MPLKHLYVRPEARLAPVGVDVAPARERLELDEQPPDGRDRVGVERVDLRREERDTDFACAGVGRRVSGRVSQAPRYL